jgi:membrane protein YdbS with pleckstrin-like domain
MYKIYHVHQWLAIPLLLLLAFCLKAALVAIAKNFWQFFAEKLVLED